MNVGAKNLSPHNTINESTERCMKAGDVAKFERLHVQGGFYLENLDDDVVADLTDIEKQLLEVTIPICARGHPLADWAEARGVTPDRVLWTVEV